MLMIDSDQLRGERHLFDRRHRCKDVSRPKNRPGRSSTRHCRSPGNRPPDRARLLDLQSPPTRTSNCRITASGTGASFNGGSRAHFRRATRHPSSSSIFAGRRRGAMRPIVDRYRTTRQGRFPARRSNPTKNSRVMPSRNGPGCVLEPPGNRSLRRPSRLWRQVRPQENRPLPSGPGAPGRNRCGRRAGHARGQRLFPARRLRDQPLRRLHHRPRRANRSTSGFLPARRNSFQPAARTITASSPSTWPIPSGSTASPTSLDPYFGHWIDRLQAWGFNSAGAFNSIPEVSHRKRFPYVSFVTAPRARLGTPRFGLVPVGPRPGREVRLGLCVRSGSAWRGIRS